MHDKVALLIDNRDGAGLLQILEHMHRQLPDDWDLMWMHGQSYTPVQPLAFLGTRRKLITQPLPFAKLNIDRYNKMVTDPAFWMRIPYEHILLFQTDSCLFHQRLFCLDQFLDYDYVGAPWTVPFGWPWDGHVGNGGFSLRRKSGMLKALRECPYKGEPEDVYFGFKCRKVIRVPPLDIAKRFSVEFETQIPYPCGFHKYRGDTQTESNARARPEMQWVRHELHNWG